MKTELTHCPMCKEKVDSFATCRASEPFTAKEPMEGKMHGEPTAPQRNCFALMANTYTFAF